MRAAVYARISRDAEGEGLGVQRQLDDCRALCERRQWQNVGEYIDNDISAYSGRLRPKYRQLLDDVRAGKVEVVVAWAPERLHRSPRELEDFIELIEATGLGVETVKAGVWDVSTSHGRLVARMLGAVSRSESERLGERVHRAHQQAKARGYWRGPIPFGMRASSQPGAPEPDPATAGVVELMFKRVVAGHSLCQIARDLNREGIRPRRGREWTHIGIRRLIYSPALAGLVEVDGELKAAVFEGVVDADEWRTALAALRRRPAGERRRPPETLTLLGNILECEEHRHKCFGTGAAHAATYQAALPGQCYVTITRAAADRIATDIVLERLRQPDAVDLLQINRDRTPIDNEISHLVRRREEIVELIADGLLTGAAARPQLDRIVQRLKVLEGARAGTGVQVDDLRDPAAAWEAWTVPQRRDLLRLLFDRITLRHVGSKNGPRADPTRVGFVWAAATNDGLIPNC
jgi:site-specific DNA recombinase